MISIVYLNIQQLIKQKYNFIIINYETKEFAFNLLTFFFTVTNVKTIPVYTDRYTKTNKNTFLGKKYKKKNNCINSISYKYFHIKPISMPKGIIQAEIR